MAKVNDWMLESDRQLLATRESEWRRSWEKIRSQGKLRFILLRYLIVWGGLQVSFEAILHWDLFHGAKASYMYGCSAFTFLTALLLGLWVWHGNEKRYRRR
jgi:hypothetical protein